MNNTVFTMMRPQTTGDEHCNGCSVCTLSCPVWNATHDLRLTSSGRMRLHHDAMQSPELIDSANACVLCGSCEPTCSFGVQTVSATLDARAMINKDSAKKISFRKKSRPALGAVLLASASLLRKNILIDKILDLLKVTAIYEDNGDDISLALETGFAVPTARINDFIDSLKAAEYIITTDGLIYRLLLRFLPEANVIGLGEALIRHGGLEERLRKDDLYVIDARTYNAGFKGLVGVYDSLRRKTGCMMNLDLHRVATPTAVVRAEAGSSVIDIQKQVQWILAGREAKRIIVERIEDKEPFESASLAPVFFVSEIA